MLILIDTIDVSDCFLIQNSEPVELWLQTLPDFGKSTNQTCWIIVTACIDAFTPRLSDLPPALQIDFLATLKLLVKRDRWKGLDGDAKSIQSH